MSASSPHASGSPTGIDSVPVEGSIKSSKRPAPHGRAAYPRKRANKACQVCRARRAKCDNNRPCSFCEKTGATCTYTPHDFSSFDPASLAILERFDQLESLLLSNGATTKSPSQPPITPQPFNPVFQAEAREDRDRLLGCFSNELISLRLEDVLRWAPLRNKSIPKDHSRTNYIDYHTRYYQGESFTPGELDMASCNEMLASFWTSVHSKNPILVQEDIRRYMNRVCMNGVSWDAQSCLVLLICALGTIASDFGDKTADEEQQLLREGTTHRLARAEYYFSAAQKRIGVCLGKRGLLEAHCFIYSGIYLATTMRPDAAWSLFLQAMASCQDFRCLSSDSRDDNQGPEAGIEDFLIVEECTYWTCLKSELELRLEVSPAGFRTIDLWYPERFPGPPRNIATGSDRSWFFYLAEISLRRLANRIMSCIARGYDLGNSRDQQRAREAASGFEQEAHDWIQSLPSPNELDNSSDDVLNFILKGHLANCHEQIYWPFVKHAMNSPLPASALDCEYLRKGLQICVDRIALNEPGFRHRHHGTWGLIRSCTRSAFVLLAAHFRGFSYLMPERWESAVCSNIDLLNFWCGEIKDADQWKEEMVSLLQDIQTSVVEERV
ncbi:C6 zinc finger domain-containing protein [Phlyctema vagabunda]|uniref:C6 zinc finger domain-containing protein n=1 Tax=Phlyctema vagabunda TaxID=108571 RepID=A0ABR4PUB4_9HELO